MFAAVSTLLEKIAPWRFLMFFALLAFGIAFAVPASDGAHGILIAFDGAALAFLLSLIPTFFDDAKRMRKVAHDNKANRVALLVLSFLITVVILVAVVSELAHADAMRPAEKAFIAASLVLVWLFANAVYALHYCHLFYTSDDHGKDCAGLNFPGTKLPLMRDFAYFSYTLGVAVQTSDVAITSPHIRAVVTVHCVAGFFFNLGVLALTINVLGSG